MPQPPKRSTYTDEAKAAVLAALLAGQSVSSVAAEYRVPAGTVKRWSAALAEQRAEIAASIEPARTAKTADVGSLLLHFVAESLKALTAQVAVFADPEWLRRQSAGELAVLHGVQTDKVVRLLEALGGPAEAPAP